MSIDRLVAGADVAAPWFRNSPGCLNEAEQHSRQTDRQAERILGDSSLL